MIKVCKFGGSSLANATQYKKIKSIVESDDTRKVIVASACGKADKNDHKVTDLLYLCLAHKKYGMSYDDILEKIYLKHKAIIDELNISFDLDSEIEKIRGLLEANKNNDEVVASGEFLSSRLLALYLNAEFVDASDVISFKYDGSIDIEDTYKRFMPHLNTNKKIVVPGFYGSLPNGVLRLMSRGGSDITGALLANICDAKMYENWTDVSGIYVCDPRIINSPKQINIITYRSSQQNRSYIVNLRLDAKILP